MSSGKYKVTGITRFLLFMIVFVPAVLAGVSYAKYGQIDFSPTGIKALLTDQPLERAPEIQIESLVKDIKELEREIQKKKEKIEKIRTEHQ
jgi:hypothetical protein